MCVAEVHVVWAMRKTMLHICVCVQALVRELKLPRINAVHLMLVPWRKSRVVLVGLASWKRWLYLLEQFWRPRGVAFVV